MKKITEKFLDTSKNTVGNLALRKFQEGKDLQISSGLVLIDKNTDFHAIIREERLPISVHHWWSSGQPMK